MIPDIARSEPELEALVSGLETENAKLREELERTRRDLYKVIEQIERLDLVAWTQIRYAVDNRIPVPEVDLPVTMFPDRADEIRRHLRLVAAVFSLSLAMFLCGLFAARL